MASGSPRRRKILTFAGIPFKVVKPHGVTEIRLKGESPARMVRRLALLKACEVARRFPHALVLGADTTVVCGREHFEKPKNRREAGEMIAKLQGRSQTVWTGVALVAEGGRWKKASAEKTRVHFREISPGEIGRYLDGPEPYDKAGAYAIQGTAREWVLKWEGDYLNVMGLPLRWLLPQINRRRANEKG